MNYYQQQQTDSRLWLDAGPKVGGFEKLVGSGAVPDYASTALGRWDSTLNGNGSNRQEVRNVPSTEQNIGRTGPEQNTDGVRLEQNTDRANPEQNTDRTRPEHSIGRTSGTPSQGGRAFLERLGGNPDYPRQNGVTGSAREQAILEEVDRGNVPEFLSQFKRVVLHDKKGNTIELDVMPDYFALGNNQDFVRMPMTPLTAKAVGDKFGLVLPTEKVADAIYRKADIKLEAIGLVNKRSDTAFMSGNGYYLRHDQLIRRQLGDENGQSKMVAGHKKDLILSKFALDHPDRLDFYGFFDKNGRRIQGSGGGPHESTYVDYSHGARFISQNVIVNGKPMRYDDVLKNPELCGLLTDEGPYDPASIYKNGERNSSAAVRQR